MNPYQVMGIIAGCTVIFVGVVSILAMQGIPLLLAFLGVYLVAVWTMVGMQKRARELYDGEDTFAQRHNGRYSTARKVRVDDLTDTDEEVLESSHFHA